MRAGPEHEGELDWTGLRRRLRAVAERTREQATPQTNEVRAILEARARQLARPPSEPLWGGAPQEYLRFSVAGEAYAAEARCLVQVFPIRDLARLPGAAPPLIAVTGWRGQILPVLDLRQALGLGAVPPADGAVGVVVGIDRPAFVVLVDELPEPVSFAPAELRPAPDGGGIRRELLLGVTAGAVLVLDMERLVRLHG